LAGFAKREDLESFLKVIGDLEAVAAVLNPKTLENALRFEACSLLLNNWYENPPKCSSGGRE